MTAQLHIGDTRQLVETLEPHSVDLILTSPPFLALRSYLPADHPDKHAEIGSESTPAAFLDTLLGLVAQWGRVLAPHGSIAVELGDTYSGGTTEQTANDRPQDGGYDKGERVLYDGYRAGIRNMNDKHQPGGTGWPEAKSLCMIPELFGVALAYGINPLTGAESPAGRWRVRNWITWARPNPPVGALGDKWRPASSFVTVACRGRSRYFDLDAVRTELQHPDKTATAGFRDNGDRRLGPYDGSQSAGAPPLDWHSDLDAGNGLLVLTTQPYKGAHYATWPEALARKLIDCMCPVKVCVVCGKPSERITERTQLHNGAVRADDHDLYTRTRGEDQPRGQYGPMPDYVATSGAPSFSVKVETVGWSDCGHGSWRAGRVLDPFGGSGTTLAVATALGRDSVGFELDPANAVLVVERCGMFCDITTP